MRRRTLLGVVLLCLSIFLFACDKNSEEKLSESSKPIDSVNTSVQTPSTNKETTPNKTEPIKTDKPNKTDIPVHKHDYIKEIYNPTCYQEGYTIYKCNCGDKYIGDYLPMSNHSMGEWQMVEGKNQKIRFCQNCDYSEETQVEIPSCKHESLKEIMYFPPTCTNNGYSLSECIDCGFQSESILDPIDHNYINSKIVLEPTCEETGMEVKTCECGHIKEIVLPILEHNYVNTQCTNCGNVNIPGILFTLDELTNTYSVSCTDKNITNVKIPATYKNLSVSTIADGAFYECYNLNSVELPDSITKIGMNAFYQCTNLSSINIPKNVDLIDAYAFSNTKITSIVIPSECEIFYYAFDNCNSLVSIELPFRMIYGNKTNIFSSFFNTVPSSLKNVTINGGIIPENAFKQLSIDNIIIKGNVESIEKNAFSYSGIKKLTFDGTQGIVLGASAFLKCVNLSEIQFLNDAYIKSIGNSAFSGCSLLEEVIFPSGLETVGNNLFVTTINDTSNLKKVVLPKTVTSIGYLLFPRTLEELEVPFIGANKDDSCEISYFFSSNPTESENAYVLLNKLTITNDNDLGECALAYLSDLKTLKLNDEIESIGNRALLQTSLTRFVAPANVEYIGYEVTRFSNIEYIELGDKIKEISSLAFSNSHYLKEVVINTSLIEIPEQMFSNCQELVKFNIPNSVKTIGNQAFIDCVKYTYNLPESIESIGIYSFYNCSHPNEIIIGKNVKSIETQAFSGITNVDKIYIPNSVESIGTKAFEAQYSTACTINELIIPFIGQTVNDSENINLDYLFGYTENISFGRIELTNAIYVGPLKANEVIIPSTISPNCTINVVAKKLTTAANGYLYFSDDSILEELIITSGNGNVSISNLINLERLEILSDDCSYYIYYCQNLKELSIPKITQEVRDNIYSIYANPTIYINNSGVVPANSFAYLECDVVFNDDLYMEIYSSAFNDYLGNNIKLSKNISKIEGNAFVNTSANIDWNDAYIEEIPEYMFSGYTADNVNIPSSVIKINQGAFNSYRGKITWENPMVTTFASNAFKGYIGEEIIIPSTVKNIGVNAFYLYSGTITWDNPTIETIVSNTFANYLGTDLVIPYSVKYIEEDAIESCQNLRNLTLPFVGTKYDGSGINSLSYICSVSTNAHLKMELDTLTLTNLDTLYSNMFEGFDFTEIILPNSLELIQANAFYDSGVKTLRIPSSVQLIEVGALNTISNLETLEIPFVGISKEKNEDAKMNYFGAIFGFKDSYNDKLSNLYYYVPSTIKNVIVNSEYIYEYAFAKATEIENITLNGIKSIGIDAFNMCYGLKNVYYNGTFDSWNYITFKNQYSNPMYYADSFYLNSNNEHIIPTKIELINSTMINDYSFVGFNNMSLVINSNITAIKDYAFAYSNISIDTTNSNIITIGEYAYLEYYGDSITIPNTVNSIDNYAFYSTYANIEFEDNIDMSIIEPLTFAYYSGLEIILPSGIEAISTRAFYMANNLHKISIPNTVNNIDPNAFEGANIYAFINDSKIELVSKELVTSEGYCFSIDEEGKYYLFDYVGSNKYLELPEYIFDNTYYISSTAFDSSDIYSVKIPSTVRNIEANAFDNCYYLVEVFNESSYEVAGINTNIRVNHSLISEKSNIIVLDDFVFVLGDDGNYYIIDYIGKNHNVILPDNINDNSYIINQYFMYKSMAYSVTMPNSITQVLDYAFSYSNIHFISGMAKIEYIGDYAFILSNCYSNIYLPDIIEIGQHSFTFLKSTDISFGNNLESIGEGSFSNCENLEYVIIPTSINSLPKNSKLTIYYEGTEEEFLNIENNDTIENVYFYISTSNYQSLEYNVVYWGYVYNVNYSEIKLVTRSEFEDLNNLY